MDFTSIKAITNYFRTSVLDSERLAPSLTALHQALQPEKFSTISKTAPFVLDKNNWHMGKIPIEKTEKIFTIAQVKKEIKSINLLLFPRVDLHRHSGGVIKGNESPIMVPMVVEVSLNRKGDLKPCSSPPFIPREWMAPNQSSQTPFTETDVVDQFLTLHPYRANSWQELLCYCGKMLKSAVLKNPLISDSKDDIKELWRADVHKDYLLKNDICLAQIETPIKAGFHIVNILDGILTLEKTNELYEKMVSKKEILKEEYFDLTQSLPHAKQHYAQMTAEFPLADKQRNALHYLNELKDGNFLVVNGPPGTGKTTLLRSVVANLWVEAALNEKEPPVIAATSSNNQAVTNIIECFSKIEESNIEETLKGRWLPGFSTYGLYACGSNKSNEENAYPYITKQGIGIMARMDDEEYIASAKAHFLQAFNTWNPSSKENITCLNKAACILLSELKKQNNLKCSLLEKYKTLDMLTEKIGSLYGSEDALDIWIKTNFKKLKELNEAIESSNKTYQEFLTCWQKRSFLENLFFFLPSIKNQREINNELIANKVEFELSEYTDEAIKSFFRKILPEKKKEQDSLYISLKEAQQLKTELTETRKHLQIEIKNVDEHIQLKELDLRKLQNLLDTTLRFEIFKIATHYWEAKWLLDPPVHYQDIKTPAQLLKRYHRYAKLAPCLVATFNMLPRFFSVSEKHGETWRCAPLFDAIDLLIVEEAGQALPHMAAASIAVSKKALVIGDVEQIEPVWSLSAGIDRANLQKFNLLLDTKNYQNYWLPSALLASSGNFMKVVHRKIKQHQCDDLNPGLYLTEHRRCYNEIIAYCNRLVYKGHLQPLRGNSAPDNVIPPMCFIHHESISVSDGSSRTNQTEAECIAKWIIENERIIFKSANKKEALAVITPFNRQALVIKRVFSRNGLSHIPVGTIHTFQGAESLMVIFSSVYGSNNTSGKQFYDMNKNMLNVAVSRAKDHFIVFGHRDVFGTNNDFSPSSILRSYLADLETVQPLSVSNY